MSTSAKIPTRTNAKEVCYFWNFIQDPRVRSKKAPPLDRGVSERNKVGIISLRMEPLLHPRQAKAQVI